MCGLFGYVGGRQAVPLLIDGLARLEYRGYDSAGLAVLTPAGIGIRKCVGKISRLEDFLEDKPLAGSVGIGHTRWATHGAVEEANSHPHLDCRGKIAVIHNGIIENYVVLRESLKRRGHNFASATDTEVLAHLIEENLPQTRDLAKAVRLSLLEVQGSYAIAVVTQDEPDRIVVARHGSPLVIGLGQGEYYIASDIPALLDKTNRVIALEDGEVAVVQKEKLTITDAKGRLIKKTVQTIDWDQAAADKQGFDRYMLKEIYEQPKVIHETFQHRISPELGEVFFEELTWGASTLKDIERIVITGCGTSWHAGLCGEYWFEQYARIPTEVEYAAEFRYRDPILDKKTLVIAISQSGETADTLAAVKEAKTFGAKVLTICNVPSSSMTREADGVIFTQAGPEVGVASTKAFTTQLVILYLLTIHLGRLRGTLPAAEAKQMLDDLKDLPSKIDELLSKPDEIKRIANKYWKVPNALYLGRGKGFPIALEGALKLKEVSYIHAEGYPAAEMKHGPIALIDHNMPVFVLALSGRRYEKILGNIEEVHARGGKIIAIANEGDLLVQEKADDIIYLPATPEAISPIVAVVPLQLLAYYIAVKRGCDVDQPRNLAKSVTVE